MFQIPCGTSYTGKYNLGASFFIDEFLNLKKLSDAKMFFFS
jgi:hypothetical protein